ncbi:MAG: ATP-binding protein [Sphingomonas sp.]
MICRDVYAILQDRITHFDSVALLGPRQVGKTTLAKAIAAEHGDSCKYLDLEHMADRRLLDDADAYFTAHADKLIVLDEVQRRPEIFSILRGQIDARRRMGARAGKFLILGSASMGLLRQSSESLAGRISYVELFPLSVREIAEKDTQSAAVDKLWTQGGFPESFLRDDGNVSMQWRLDFIQTYIERDLPNFGFRVAGDRVERLWRMLANDQGELFNAERYARSLGTTGHSVARYIEILNKLLLVRLLRPWSTDTGKRLVKSSRVYVRDSGILHALLNLTTVEDVKGHPVAGKSWEGFVVENLIGAARGRARPYFYRSGAGAEADLVLEFAPKRNWAFEIKLSSSPALDRGFHHASQDLATERRIIIYRGHERFSMRGGVEAMSLMDAVTEVDAVSRL